MNASLAKPVDWLEEQDRWVRAQVVPHSLTHLRQQSSTCSHHGGGRAAPGQDRSILQCGTTQLMTVQVKENGDSALWQMLDLVLTQFDGLVTGYQARHAEVSNALLHLSRRDLIFLNGNGESVQLAPPD